MEPRDAVRRVLAEETDPTHWTKVQDLALRRGYLDPFEHPDVRRAVQTALRELVQDGLAVRVSKGVYAEAPPDEA
jgi:hypothetical protein